MHADPRLPQRCLLGADVTRRIASGIRAVGLEGPVLIAAGSSAVGRLAPVWADAFAAAGWTHRVLAVGVAAHERETAAIAAESRTLGAGVIVATGGGRTLAAGRAAAAAVGVAFVSCPTICSTGTAAHGPGAIETAAGDQLEEPIRTSTAAVAGRLPPPELVLIDTQVIAESPPRFLAAGIGAAVAGFHEARAAAAGRGERITTAAANRMTACRDVMLAHGLDALAACRSRTVSDSLERVVEAALLLAGLGCRPVGRAAAHAFHDAITCLASVHGVLHGETLAFATLVQLALEATHGPDAACRTAIRTEAERVAALFVAIGLPVTLDEIGVDAEDAATMRDLARRAAARDTTIHRMPFVVDAPRVAEAIRAADSLGRSLHGLHSAPRPASAWNTACGAG